LKAARKDKSVISHTHLPAADPGKGDDNSLVNNVVVHTPVVNNHVDYHQLFQHSLQQSIIFLPVLDASGRLEDALVREVNPAFAQLTGIPPEAVRGRLVSQMFPGVTQENPGAQALREDVAAVVSTGKALRRELYFDPLERHFLYQVFPLQDGMIALVSIDITAQKEAAQALQENQQRLTLSEERAQLKAAQVQLQHKLIESRETERQSIANRLHEGLLQTLIGVRYAIDEGLSLDQKEMRLAKLAGVQAVMQREIQNLRDYCNELRPPTLSPFGLEKTIRAHVEAFQKKHSQPAIHLELSPDRQALPEQTRLVLFRVFQELLKDAVSRPAVRRVWLRFDFNAAQAALEVEDDGPSPLAPLQWTDLTGQGQLGLASALNQVEGLGGTVSFSASQENGTKVRVVVPIGKESLAV
jgi:signal transduction histidine kinase